MWKEISVLIRKEITLEWRQKYALNGILLYVVSAVFITYLSVGAKMGNLSIPTWNALFWIIILFAFINAANNTFRNDTENTQGYLNQLAHPNSILAAKTLYNAFLMTITGLVNYFCYSLFIGNLIENQWLFLLLIIIAAVGFAAVLSLTNAISSKASFNNTLMPILSLPVLIPFFIILVAQTNHLIGNKEYHDFSFAQAREATKSDQQHRQCRRQWHLVHGIPETESGLSGRNFGKEPRKRSGGGLDIKVDCLRAGNGPLPQSMHAW